MLRIASITTLIGIAVLLSGGCDRKSPPTEKQDATPQTAAEPKHSSNGGHNHAAGKKCNDHADHDHDEASHDEHEGHDHGEAGHDDHEGHNHGEAAHGHGHSGERHELGNREIAGITVNVAQFGAATDNAVELVFEINIQGESSPTAVRLLVRTPDGAESLKVKANKVGDHKYDAHVGELPTKLGKDSVLVVEVETQSGTEELTFLLKT